MTRFALVNVIVVVLVATVAGIAAWQLARTVRAAQGINDKAAHIAQSGRGINIATDSVVQLNRTNATAGSILRSASPLDEKLASIVSEARGINNVARGIDGNAGTIDQTAGSINSEAGSIDSTAGRIEGSAGRINSTAGAIEGTAGSIDRTAGAINGTAGGINVGAAAIVPVAKRIDEDVNLINVFLNQSIRIARPIKRDTGDILRETVRSHDTAACIDRKVGGRRGNDGDCRGRPS